MPLTLEQMIALIHAQLKRNCFSDIVDETEVSITTVWNWRNQPPAKPSLHVFCRLAEYCGLNPTIEQLRPLY